MSGHLAHEARVYDAEYDVAGNIQQALTGGSVQRGEGGAGRASHSSTSELNLSRLCH
jgi:hypothetical protein